MLTKAKALKGYQLKCLDGEIGKVKEFFFNDQTWKVRYLVADTGSWLIGRQVLILPIHLTGVDREKQLISVNLTKKQIEDCPPLSSDKPVSRHFEEAFFAHLGVPIDWEVQARGPDPWDPHLRSTHDVSGHGIHAADGEIGHVDDFIIDDEKWAIRYLVIETGDWWPEKKVLVSPHWIEKISWDQSKVFVKLTLAKIRQAPEYAEGTMLTRDYEKRLHDYYDRRGYWVESMDNHKPTFESPAGSPIIKARN
jgi:uncharacterized protein YrrD